MRDFYVCKIYYYFSVFSDDKLLQTHYTSALLSKDVLLRIEGHLLADVHVFVRWMDGKNYQTDPKNIMNKRVVRVWENDVRKPFEAVYDSYFDESDIEVD